MNPKDYIRGRGAQSNPDNSFHKTVYESYFDDYKLLEEQEDLTLQNNKTQFLPVHPKTILNPNPRPYQDGYSMNPYQGCEHGCAYCYARNSHEYWGYSAGMDFEQKILYKKNAAEVLEKEIRKKGYKPMEITLSGNTDCYQPVERNMKLTRQCLDVLLKWKHPTAIITKNNLVERDIDIYQEMARYNLIRIHISLNTTNEDIKRIMEPRTSSVKSMLRTISLFSENKIPIYVLAMPIVPGINDDTLPELIKMTSEVGASNIYYQPVKLSKNLEYVFVDWLDKNFPDRKEKVMNRLNEIYGNDIGTKHKNKDSFWHNSLRQQFEIYKKKYYSTKTEQIIDFSHFNRLKNPQLEIDFPQLFDK